MSNILAINPGHNGSAALVSDGKLVFYVEEERLSRMKYDGNPYMGMLHAIEKYGVDKLIIAGTGQERHQLPWTGENSYTALVRKFNPKVEVIEMGHEHHVGHVTSAFYNSGFDTAVAVIADGAGSHQNIQLSEQQSVQAYETETIAKMSYPANIEVLWKRYGDNRLPKLKNSSIDLDDAVTTTKAYEAVSEYLGFGFIEAGKTMGLAPYGEEDENIPRLLAKHDGRGSKDVFIPHYPAGAIIDQERNPYLKLTEDPRGWHENPSKLTDAQKNLAYAIQKETEEYIGNLIEQAVDMSGETNVVIAGGYGLNCVANYYYKERFPDLNIFVDPVSHDGGTAIGLAKFFHYMETESTEKDPLTTLYLGPEHKYTKKDLPSDLEVEEVSPADVAKLISEKNIVAMFQGRSEAGPRALGNRSILYNPTDPKGKDHVNTVKGREWFRPFAGTVMQEYAGDWFDLKGMDETPFMMYAVDVKDEKVSAIPNICHVDDTCRIQTVTKEQNENYYNLIDEFRKITDVPVLFNTSFNLAGEPLVETLDEAIATIKNSGIEYLYLPELGVLVKSINE